MRPTTRSSCAWRSSLKAIRFPPMCHESAFGLGLVLATGWPAASLHRFHPSGWPPPPSAPAACQPLQNHDRFLDLLSLCA
jgi:hypothetical protein